MSVQKPDYVDFQGAQYSLTAIDGKGLFEPAFYGITPIPISTACWRGCVATYDVANDIRLVHLEIGSLEAPKPIGAIFAFRLDAPRTWVYDELSISIPFDGRLLIGRDLAKDRPYLPIGFWPAWFFEYVFELRFDRGRMTDFVDRSNDLAQVRARILEPARDGLRTVAKPKDTDSLIKRSMSLSFSYSWPGHP